MVSSAIVTENLRVRRGKHEVLHGIDLDIPRGGLVGLLGPSGSGKTTLMRSIVGVQRGVTGTATVLGLPAGSAALRRQLGYVTQDASVYTDLTVRQNLKYFAAVAGAPRSDVDRVIEATDLGGQANQVVSSLSGGQLSRASLAAALLGEPKLLVLDEPTVGLDPVLRVALWTLFADLVASGTTVLVSSHVMDEASRCDRLLLVREGEILADETPAGLLESTGAANTEGAFLWLIEQHPTHQAKHHPKHLLERRDVESGDAS